MSAANQTGGSERENVDGLDLPRPTNSLVTALLTDMYQITMSYAHWKNNRHEDPAVFELFFRKNPFEGEFTIMAGLDECLKHVQHFWFTVDEINYLRTIPALQHCDDGFFDYLQSITPASVKIRAVLDGTVVFPRVPLLVVEAPLAVGQLLETTLLNLINFPTLVATNAARMVLVAQDKSVGPLLRRYNASSNNKDHDFQGGPNNGIRSSNEADGSHLTSPTVGPSPSLVQLPRQCSRIPVCVEFGLRRAQGPDGGFAASKYSSIGGFVATSNVQAGKFCDLSIAGTHAHSFVQSYSSLQEVQESTLLPLNKHISNDILDPEPANVMQLVLKYRNKLGRESSTYYNTTNDGELAAFIAYACAFPHNFLCLIDTYDTLHSGLLNFILVALVLDDLGYKPKGVRLDSGDLAYLSMECALTFATFAAERPVFHNLDIVASNDINEDILRALNEQGHAITVYGIGTNLVTCQKQPALGGVYKLVEIAGKPRMKLSQDIAKVLIPGKKSAFRLIGKDGQPILDLMVANNESQPAVGQRILCRHPFLEQKRAAVTPSRVKPLLQTVFENGRALPGSVRSLEAARTAAKEELKTIRPDVLRFSNPTPYKVSVSAELFTFLHDLWQSETPVAELS